MYSFDDVFGTNTKNTTTPQSSGNFSFDDIFGGNSTPAILKTAKQIGGQNDPSYRGYCQKFVDDAIGVPYPRTGKESAISAWDTSQNKVEGLQGIKKGDLVYFYDPTGKEQDGHVGIFEGGGQFYSARDDGIKDDTLTNWNQETGQVPLGYIPQ